MNRVIAWSVAHARIVIGITLGLLALGGWAAKTTRVDAIPDL